MVQQGYEVVNQELERELPITHFTSTLSTQVTSNHTVNTLENLDLIGPHLMTERETVNQHDRGTRGLTDINVIEPRSVR
jgi:hypothetical protein